MPAPYGVTPTGFNRPTLQELVELFEADQHAEISPTLDVSTDALVGQLNGIYARQLDIAWETIETAYHGFDPDRAEDFLLTALGKITGTQRRGASASEVDLDCVLDVGTVLLAGVHFAHTIDKPDERWTPKADFTAPSTGHHIVTFIAEQLGPIEASPDTITVIATTVVGWNDPVTNPDEATPGRNSDDDPTLRERREAQLTAAGSATTTAIKADLLEIDGIDTVLMFENDTDVVNADGIPPHSFEAVIYDGGVVANDLIAQTIWDAKAAGIRAFGATSGTAVDANGDPQTVPFTRVTEIPIWMNYTRTAQDGYVGDTDFKKTIAARLNEQFGIGDDVTLFRVTAAAFDLGAEVTDVTFGTTTSPTTSTPLVIAARELARFDASRILLF